MSSGPAKVVQLTQEKVRLIRALKAAAKALRDYGHIPEARKAESVLFYFAAARKDDPAENTATVARKG